MFNNRCAYAYLLFTLLMTINMYFFPGMDLIPLFGTFLCCLFLGVEIGLVCGVGVDALLLLYYHSRPPLDVQYIDVSI